MKTTWHGNRNVGTELCMSPTLRKKRRQYQYFGCHHYDADRDQDPTFVLMPIRVESRSEY
jgi:hypothetical protein